MWALVNGEGRIDSTTVSRAGGVDGKVQFLDLYLEGFVVGR